MTATTKPDPLDPYDNIEVDPRHRAIRRDLSPDDQLEHLQNLVDESLAFMRVAAREFAEAEDSYRLTQASHMLAARNQDGVKTADERKAWVDLQTSDERQRAHLAADMKDAAKEAARSRRAQLSAFQTWLNSQRAEAEFSRTSPYPGGRPQSEHPSGGNGWGPPPGEGWGD